MGMEGRASDAVYCDLGCTAVQRLLCKGDSSWLQIEYHLEMEEYHIYMHSIQTQKKT